MPQTPDLFRQTAVAQRLPSDVASSLKRSLTSWDLTDDLPAIATPEILSAAIYDARDAMKPASPKAVGVLVDRLFSVLPMPDAAGIKVWRREMERYPVDLLENAVDEVIRKHVWESVPKVGQLVAEIRSKLSERGDWLRRLETAAFKARMTQRRSAANPAPADRGPIPERLQQLVAETVAKLSQPCERERRPPDVVVDGVHFARTAGDQEEAAEGGAKEGIRGRSLDQAGHEADDGEAA